MSPFLLGIWGVAFFAALAALMALINTYIILWALGQWGVIDSDWQEVFVGSLWAWTDQFSVFTFIADLMSIPFQQVQFILQRLDPSTASYHFLFLLLVYPSLYLITMQLSVTNLLSVPLLAVIYLIEP